MKCSKCGSQLENDANFCTFCGQKIVKEPVKNDKKTN